MMGHGKVRPQHSCSDGDVREGRESTVAKPLLLKRLGLPLSEEQIPQVVEKIESGGESEEALE